MLNRIHQKLGTAGFILAIVALVAALAGTAFAAKDVLTKQEKKQVEKIAKKFAGKEGPAGPQGPPGPQGAAGANGKDGANGADGTNGTNGKSVNTGSEAPGGNCAEGGSWFEIEGSGTKTFACNGESSSGPLGAGETEVGNWSFSTTNAHPYATISFPRPIASFKNIEWIGVGESEPTKCPGTVAEPKAASGQLCVYAEQVLGTEKSFPEFNGNPDINSGVILEFEAEAGKESRGKGSWALTAP